MNNSKIISIILVFVFMAKFLAVDANALVLFKTNGKINFINPHCKKLNAPKQIADFADGNKAVTQTIILNGTCTPQFIIESFAFETSPISISQELATFHTTSLNYLYLEHVVPPPRV